MVYSPVQKHKHFRSDFKNKKPAEVFQHAPDGWFKAEPYLNAMNIMVDTINNYTMEQLKKVYIDQQAYRSGLTNDKVKILMYHKISLQLNNTSMRILHTILLIALFRSSYTYSQNVKSKDVECTYVQLPAYDVGTVNPTALIAEFAIGNCDFGKELLKDTKSTCVPKGGSVKDAVQLTTYYYEIPFTQAPSYLVAKDPAGAVIYASRISNSGNGTVRFGFNECKYWVSETMKKDFAGGAESFKNSERSKYENDQYALAQTDANINLLVSTITDKFELNYAKGKDVDYTQLDKAYEIALAAYSDIKSKGPNTAAISKLNEAITIWLKELESANLENNDARINKKIAQALHENLAIAYMYSYMNDKALEHARKALAMWGNLTTNKTIEWKAFVNTLEKRAVGTAKNPELIKNLSALMEKANSMKKTTIKVTRLGNSDVNKLEMNYKTYSALISSPDNTSFSTDINDALSTGVITKYDKYITVTSTGKVLMIMSMMEKMTEFPKEICGIKDLSQIHIASNTITTVPAEIGQLTTLKKLNLSGNNISELPKEIGMMSSLNTLDLDKNPIKSLPLEIKNCTELKTLSVKGTLMTPETVAELQKLLPNCTIKLK